MKHKCLEMIFLFNTHLVPILLQCLIIFVQPKIVAYPLIEWDDTHLAHILPRTLHHGRVHAPTTEARAPMIVHHVLQFPPSLLPLINRWTSTHRRENTKMRTTLIIFIIISTSTMAQIGQL